jgi:DNA replication and repair protein RecF
MIVKNLHISNLRNHGFSDIEFNSNVNLIHGRNGSGKTTILEALSISSISKSFLPSKDEALIQFGEESYHILAKCESDLNVPYHCSVHYETRKKKQIRNSRSETVSPRNLIGEMPSVVLSPDHKSITFGSPSHRRDFVDRVLCQSSVSYLKNLSRHKKTLRQRNSLLAQIKKRESHDFESLKLWTNNFIDLSAEIIFKRNEFIINLSRNFKKAYSEISVADSGINLIYQAHGVDNIDEMSEKENIISQLENEYEKRKDEELQRGTSTFGPQKDDIRIEINGGLARDTASQGQHKTLLISLKTAEFVFLREKCNETPILLLDDIFSELDSERASHVLELIGKNKVQTFITSTNKNIDGIDNVGSVSLFELKSGKIL